MGKVSYAVNERVRLVMRYGAIGALIMVLLSPFFIFSSFGAGKIHGWSVRHDSPRMHYTAARIHCMMGALSDKRYITAQEYFEEFVEKYPDHAKTGHAYFYIGWSIENQKRPDKRERRNEAKEAYETFVAYYPDHEKQEAAKRALNRIEVDSGGR